LIQRNNLTQAETTTIFSGHQQRAWAVIAADPSVNLTLLGTREKLPDISVTEFPTFQVGPQFVSPINNNTGILGTIPTRYFVKFNTLTAVPVPYYNINSTSKNVDDLDDVISAGLKNIILQIAKSDTNGINSGNFTRLNEIFTKIGEILEVLPHGTIYFRKIDHENLKYSWNLQFGEDSRVSASSNFPPAGRRLILHQTQLDNGILRNSNISKLGSAQITQGFRIMPEVASTEIKLAFGGVIGGILYPFGVSFLLPIFAIILVQEKEKRILVMMKMNGMKSLAYYISHYGILLLIYCDFLGSLYHFSVGVFD
jgi:hypothetical protein